MNTIGPLLISFGFFTILFAIGRYFQRAERRTLPAEPLASGVPMKTPTPDERNLDATEAIDNVITQKLAETFTKDIEQSIERAVEAQKKALELAAQQAKSALQRK